ncbi:MAG TPA: hypothetical protein VKJ67_14055 [Methylomirabilota bacterium]|nr:hypothetical protein [Methylomirabilota bacterium]
MDAITPTKPILPGKPLRCPSPIEVDSTDLEIPAATVKAWIAHLRSHGWTDHDLDLQWISRARSGVIR